MVTLLFLAYFILTLLALANRWPCVFWEVGSLGYLLLATFVFPAHFLTPIVWVVILTTIFLLHCKPLRNFLVHYIYTKALVKAPKLSKTEEQALNVGDTWLEKDIFIGEPDWEKLATISSVLTAEEQSFLDNETQTLCDMLDHWQIAQDKDLPEEVWSFLKKKGFFGLVIDKKYGGKGFSARAHSDIVIKIASRSVVAAVTVMVPNSLGPGELIHHYGTEEQKSTYLPALAAGKEIPCFALTEPGAGSDATALQSVAIVEERTIRGKTVLGLSIPYLNKRWITLSPVATLIGLAVMLKDPNGLLKEEEGGEGITCLLIPRNTKNLEIGSRHLPADQPFMNGTIRGNDLFVPLSCIIGGPKNAGQGWHMLVECLSIGRSISLPALAAASSSVAYMVTGAFARIRRQFYVEIGEFEGVEEKLAEIAGLNYLINATRHLTIAAVNAKKKPSVASAITKYFNTELARIVINDAMDVHAGRGIVVGPRNYLMGMYMAIPISITVEGANIMTRNLLIFGQGSIACHPFIKEEFYALAAQDETKFGSLLWKHIGYFLSNFAKTILSAWTGGAFISVPNDELQKEYKRLTRLSYAFAWLADFALIYFAGELKRKERLSARLADGLSYLYLAMATLRYYQAHEKQADQKLHALWALSFCFYHAQKSMIAFCNNFPHRIVGFVLRMIVFPFGQTMKPPRDMLEQQLAKTMKKNNHYRNELKKMVYLSGNSEQPVDRMEEALQLILANSELYLKVADLKRYGFSDLEHQLKNKVMSAEISVEEMERLLVVERAKWDAIQVDDFPFESLKKQQESD